MLVNFRRKLLLTFIFFLSVSGVFAQQDKNWLDYQYLRTDAGYISYNAFSTGIKSKFRLELTLSKHINQIKYIYLISGTNKTKIGFKVIDDLSINDNASLRSMTVTFDLEKYWVKNRDCELVIKMETANELYFELPFFSCVLRNAVNN